MKKYKQLCPALWIHCTHLVHSGQEKEAKKNTSKNENSSQKVAEDSLASDSTEKLSNKPKINSLSANLEISFDDSSDEDQDILTIKRKDHDIPDANIIKTHDFNEDIIPKPGDEKIKIKDPLTKAAMAKKILKKGIKANQVVKFDAEGDAIENVNTQKISQEGKDYDEDSVIDESTQGGINIEDAARVLKAEDQYDKQIEREKVISRLFTY